jgi:predicted permease
VDAFVVLIGCLVLGALVARSGRAPAGMADALAFWVVQVALPATVLALIPRLSFSVDLWFLAAPHWLALPLAAALAVLLGRRLGWPRQRIGAVILIAGLANTSFVGFPLLAAVRGHEALSLGVVADQAGAFLAMALGGITIAARFAGGQVTPAVVIRKIATFPPTLALIGGALVGALGGWPVDVERALLTVGHTLSPLALFVVGLRLRLVVDRALLPPLLLALTYRLLVWPAITLGLGLALGVGGDLLAIGVLQAAMAPMITATILCEREGLEPALAHAALAYGILASLLTVPAWSAVLSAL